jgi:hypothetical protein
MRKRRSSPNSGAFIVAFLGNWLYSRLSVYRYDKKMLSLFRAFIRRL